MDFGDLHFISSSIRNVKNTKLNKHSKRGRRGGAYCFHQVISFVLKISFDIQQVKNRFVLETAIELSLTDIIDRFPSNYFDLNPSKEIKLPDVV